jgi:hypothetical protein
MGQGDIHGELGVVPPPSAQLQTKPHRAGERGRNIALPVHLVDRPQRPRHQHLQGRTDRVVAVVAEQQLRLAIHKPDHPCVVHPHQCIRHRVQQTLISDFFVFEDIAPLAAVVARQLVTGTPLRTLT